MTCLTSRPRDGGWRITLLLAILLLAQAGSPALAADDPDLIFRRSTVFKWLSPNDKLATYGIDDPEVEGVACHFTVPERGRRQRLARISRAGVGHFAGMQPDRPY